MKKNKIEINDTYMTASLKISDGNIGAAHALLEVSSIASKVDPANVFGAMGPLVLLGNYDIYGPSVHILFKYACESNPARMISVIRATQLGKLTREELKVLATRDRDRDREQSNKDKVKESYLLVKETLEIFDPNNSAKY